MEVHYPINTKNAILLSRVKAIAYTWKKKKKDSGSGFLEQQ